MKKTFEQVLRDKIRYGSSNPIPDFVTRTISVNAVVEQIGPLIYLKLYGVKLPFHVEGDTVKQVEE